MLCDDVLTTLVFQSHLNKDMSISRYLGERKTMSFVFTYIPEMEVLIHPCTYLTSAVMKSVSIFIFIIPY